MSQHDANKWYPVEEAVRAQKALRELANLGPEMFPVEAFVGMISDEIEELRRRGHTDEEIAAVVRKNSKIDITGVEIASNFATPEQRHKGD